MLVVRTLPGSAHAIAAALDRARWPEVAGSIAGDDTLFVAFPDRGSRCSVSSAACCISPIGRRASEAAAARGATRFDTAPCPRLPFAPGRNFRRAAGPRSPGVLSFIPTGRSHDSTNRTAGACTLNNKPTYLVEGRPREAPRRARRDGLASAAPRSRSGSTTPRSTATSPRTPSTRTPRTSRRSSRAGSRRSRR